MLQAIMHTKAATEYNKRMNTIAMKEYLFHFWKKLTKKNVYWRRWSDAIHLFAGIPLLFTSSVCSAWMHYKPSDI